MKSTITVKIPTRKAYQYPIVIADHLLENIDHSLFDQNKTLVIITDHIVQKLYGDALLTRLQTQAYRVILLVFDAGEISKTQATYAQLTQQMLEQRCNRESCILALGGGVVGDMAGFIAATYMRGIPYWQMPTTLLAMLDSSVGGKTAIDTPNAKNVLGAFWQPQGVLIDVQCLASLPKIHLINGLVEAIKIFLSHDQKSFFWLRKNIHALLKGDNGLLRQVIQRAIKIKAKIIATDEHEKNNRKTLNFGHTIGHALETLSQYRLLHGYAVAYGILLEAKIAQCMGLLAHAHYILIAEIFAECGILSADLLNYPFDIDIIIEQTQCDKKVSLGQVHYVLLIGIGSLYINQGAMTHPVTDDWVKKAYIDFLQD